MVTRRKGEFVEATSSVISNTAAAAAAASGHAPEAILGAAAAAALEPVLRRGLAWIAQVVKRGSDRAGMSPQELLASLESSAAQTELLIKALELARSASLASKREAIASALAAGTASEEAAVSETEFLRIVADLDVAHVEALRLLSEPRPSDLPRSALLGQLNFDPEDLGVLSPTLRGREGRLLAVLVAHGLAERDSSATWDSVGSPSWHITPFGREMLDRFMEGAEPT